MGGLFFAGKEEVMFKAGTVAELEYLKLKRNIDK
jgi:hypothetical protein